MKNKKYHSVGTIPTSNIKIVDIGKVDTPNTQIHDFSLSWLDTGTSITSGRVKLVIWTQSFPLSEMMRSCKCCTQSHYVFQMKTQTGFPVLKTTTYNETKRYISIFIAHLLNRLGKVTFIYFFYIGS